MTKIRWLMVLPLVLFLAPIRAHGGDTAEPAEKGTLAVGVQSTAVESTKQLSVNVARDSAVTAAEGTADVVGFPMIQNGQWGDIDWKVNGTQIIGTVKSRDGTTEGTFEGTVTATGVSGKFTHVDGRVGLWSWNGPPPVPAEQQ